MSDDIVKELRESRIALHSTARKAADEIEKLREELDVYDEKTKELCDEITHLSAENEKLREALKPLAAITLWTDKYPDGPLSVGDNQRYIDPQWIVRARAALESVTEPSAGENNGK